MDNNIKLQLGLGAVIAVVGVIVYFDVKDTVKSAATAVGTAVNPTSKDNLVNKGIEAVGKSVSGNEGWTLGGWIFDATHPNAARGDEQPKIRALTR